MTAAFLLKDQCPFRLVVEPQEAVAYAGTVPPEALLVAPEDFSKRGQGSIPVRNFVWEHSVRGGYARHWILDDNIWNVQRRWKGKRIVCNAGPALSAVEDFVDRYENIAITGLNYTMFVPNDQTKTVFCLNCHVYSCLLIRNDLPFRWRGRYNEDTDLCLQALSFGLCTVLINVFLIKKVETLRMKGGNMETLYQGDGRLKMARSLERMWPGVVRVDRRYGRPQHVVDWKKFKMPLVLKPDAEQGRGEYGMRLEQVRKIRSDALRRLVEDVLVVPGRGGQEPF